MKPNCAVVAIAAGGTGGHIFPAVATGEKLREMVPGIQVYYACGERPLEISLYERSGIEPVVFPARQLRPGIIGKIGGAMAAGANLVRAGKWLRAINADAVVGFGGYVSGPTVLAGKLIGCKTVIHEANSIPGKTNKILSPWMTLSAAHFEATLTHMGGNNKVAVGMPIRQLAAASTKEEARTALGLEPATETLLIMGGSQGAKFLYESIVDLLPQLDNQLEQPLQILWSTGDKNISELKAAAEQLHLDHIDLMLVPFIRDMGNALRAADVAVARAGASALAELISFGVYTIYVPFPGAIYDHQTLNAAEAERYGLGRVVKEPDVSLKLVDEILTALNMQRTGADFNPPQSLDSTLAADRLAGEIAALLRI